MRPRIHGRIVTDRNAAHEKRTRVGRALVYMLNFSIHAHLRGLPVAEAP